MSSITDVHGVLVGHHTDSDAATGCTVVLLPSGTVGGYALVGAAPATRETHVMDPANLVSEVHAFVISGGSAYGLAAAHGVMEHLEEQGTGFRYGGAIVPIVPAACLFDLGCGDGSVRPGAVQGRAAAEVASVDVAEGSVGAGTGATVAKWAGPEHACKGGLGTASAGVADTAVVVGAVVACNAAGDVLDEHGAVLAGTRTDRAAWNIEPGMSTTLAVVATNARLDKPAATHVARMCAVGIARSTRPAHTRFDGDIVFCGATGGIEIEPTLVGAVGAEVVAEALRRGVRAAVGLGGFPGLADPPQDVGAD